jgi:hypothetical protein
MTQRQEDILMELGRLMHPHLGYDNHTNRLIKQLNKREKLLPRDYFDLGKYYDRMLPMLDEHKDFLLVSHNAGTQEVLGAILELKYTVG